MQETWDEDLRKAASWSSNIFSSTLWTAIQSMSFHFLAGPRSPFLINGKHVRAPTCNNLKESKIPCKTASWKKNKKLFWAVEWHYIDKGSLIDSSINLTASSFLFDSKTNSISAAAALCIKESAGQETREKIPGNYGIMSCIVYWTFPSNKR